VSASEEFVVSRELDGRRIDAALKALSGWSWEQARRAIAKRQVSIDGRVSVDGAERVREGMRVRVDRQAPGKRAQAIRAIDIVHLDHAVVVVNKPAGVSTVPYGDESPDDQRSTLDALVRAALSKKLGQRGRPSLGIVQRLDKETSGLIVFARTLAAKKHLAQQLRRHSMHRRYLAIAHGSVTARTIETRLVKDRGDGLRGSTADPRLGQPAITHVEPIEALAGATLIACRLETGRTHQIRIHLSEAGHPLVGERVYIRGYRGPHVPAPRLMLHARELGFIHPSNGRELMFTIEPPEDFRQILARLRCSPARGS
jgi:23S rRNA pseudouridine1911/1915/1917 synthase